MQEEKTKEQHRLYCTQCKRGEFYTRDPRIDCANCGQQLTENFPHEELLTYCCGCESFYHSTAAQNNEAELECLSCDRAIARRFLCDNCDVISLEPAIVDAKRSVEFSEDGRPLPACPGCLEPVPADGILSHDCYRLFFTYSTTREQCPFCNDPIRALKLEETVEEVSSQKAGSNADFRLFQSFLQRDAASFNWRSHLPKSKRGWLELITVAGFIITAFAFVLAWVPAVPAALNYQVEKAFRTPLTVSSIECSAHVVLGGDRLTLKARAEDAANDLKFYWTSSAGALVNHKDHEGHSQVELDTGSLSAVAVPTEVTVQVVVRDRYGDRVAQRERITVMPRRMANNPPVLKIPPRCHCALQEVTAGDRVSLYALAEDEDQSEGLIYSWDSSSPAAQIVTTDSTPGSTVILNTAGVSPKSTAVPVKISLRVSDRDGGEVMGDITLMVLPGNFAGARDSAQVNPPRPNRSPKLEAFGADKTTIQAGESVRLWALVTDADEDSPLYYHWRATAGEIQDMNETAILSTAGITASEVIVVLTISDGHGGQTSQKMFLTIINSPEVSASPSPSPSPAQSRVNDDH